MPVNFISEGIPFSGTIDFGLSLKFDNTTKWKVDLSFNPVVTQFDCKENQEWCANAKNYLTTDFSKDVFLFSDPKEHNFD